jgi:formyltetrahydrofolate synthetase
LNHLHQTISRFTRLKWDCFEKVETIAKEIYRADEVIADQKIRDQLKSWEEQGYGNLPVCMAKTQYSFTTDPNRRGAPTGHSLPIREVGFLLVQVLLWSSVVR